MSFALPSEDDYHIIAVTPLVDNAYVTHHANLIGCELGTGEISILILNPLTAKLFNLNFHPLGIVSR